MRRHDRTVRWASLLAGLGLLGAACASSGNGGWRAERPTPDPAPCDGTPPETLVLLDSAPGRPAVRVLPTTLDVVGGDPTGLMVDACGEPVAIARRVNATAVMFLPPPPNLSPALTSYDIDPTGTRISYVTFDGQHGAEVVVRSLPGYRLVARSRRVTVPPTDTQCGFAVMGEDGYWEGYVCLDDVHYVWFRGDVRGNRISEDTIRAEVASSPFDTRCLVPQGDFAVCAARAAGILSLAHDSTWSLDREVRFWVTDGMGIPSRLVVIRQHGDTVQGQVLLLWPTRGYLKYGTRDDWCGQLWMNPRATACVARGVPEPDWGALLRELDAAGLGSLPAYPVWPMPCGLAPKVIDPTPPSGFTDRLPKDALGCVRIYEGGVPWLEGRTSAGHWEYHFQQFPDPVHPALPRDRALLDILFCTISTGPRPCPPRPRSGVF